MEIKMLTPAHSWLLIVGLTTLLLVVYVLAERAADSFGSDFSDEDDDDWKFDHADSDLGI
jgi:hypothetical protein